MSTQKYHAFEKTAMQARMSIGRLEAIINHRHSSDEEKELSQQLITEFKRIRAMIPERYIDVDLLKE